MARTGLSARMCLAVLAAAFLAGVLSAGSARAGDILYVWNSTYQTDQWLFDKGLQDHLTSQGHALFLVEETLCQTSDADGMDLVIVSSTVTSGNVANKYTDVPIGVITWEPALFDPPASNGFGLADTGGFSRDGETSLVITADGAAHPLGAGLAEGTYEVFSPAQKMALFSAASVFGSGAEIIARSTGVDAEACIVAYDAGALLYNDVPAPGRRVGMFLFERGEYTLTPTGEALFDAAVNWAIPEPATLALLVIGAVAALRRRKQQV